MQNRLHIVLLRVVTNALRKKTWEGLLDHCKSTPGGEQKVDYENIHCGYQGGERHLLSEGRPPRYCWQVEGHEHHLEAHMYDQ